MRTTEGVVVGDFEGTAANSGFFIQDPIGDGDAATSDGIFVFTGSSETVDAGDYVRVTGFARERFNQTAFNGTNSNTSPVHRHPQLRHRQRRGRPTSRCRSQIRAACPTWSGSRA